MKTDSGEKGRAYFKRKIADLEREISFLRYELKRKDEYAVFLQNRFGKIEREQEENQKTIDRLLDKLALANRQTCSSKISDEPNPIPNLPFNKYAQAGISQRDERKGKGDA